MHMRRNVKNRHVSQWVFLTIPKGLFHAKHQRTDFCLQGQSYDTVLYSKLVSFFSRICSQMQETLFVQ